MEMGKIGSFVKSDVFVTPMKCLFWMNAWIKVFISSCGKGGFWSRTLIIKARFESIKKSNIPIKVIIVSAAVKKEDRKMLLIKYKNYNDLPLLARWLIFEKGILHAYYIYYYLFRLCSKMSYSLLSTLSEAKKSSELDPELMRPGFQAPKYGC